LIALVLFWSTYIKFFKPVDQLAAMWPWAGDNPGLVKISAVFDCLGGAGMIFPMLFRIQPRLTLYAAYGVIALMTAAIIFHLSRGESNIGINLIVMAVAGFVAWGRRNTQ
jgi:putative oxidoreductase